MSKRFSDNYMATPKHFGQCNQAPNMQHDIIVIGNAFTEVDWGAFNNIVSRMFSVDVSKTLPCKYSNPQQ